METSSALVVQWSLNWTNFVGYKTYILDSPSSDYVHREFNTLVSIGKSSSLNYDIFEKEFSHMFDWYIGMPLQRPLTLLVKLCNQQTLSMNGLPKECDPPRIPATHLGGVFWPDSQHIVEPPLSYSVAAI